MKDVRSVIMVVDDAEVSLSICKHILKEKYKIYTANSAKVLFEILERILPDLILLDILMPDVDGYETAKRLKNNELYKDIPIIFLTALNDKANRAEGFRLGAVDYIHKPFDEQELLYRIETQLKILGLHAEFKEIKEDLV